jgi:hypothetical protein
MAQSNHSQYYLEFIQKVWQGALSATADQINPDVQSITNTVYTQIKNCSANFLSIDETFQFFYSASSFLDLVVSYLISGITGSITAWINAIFNSPQYRTCVTATALNWKSAMALALLGLARKSDAEITQYLKEHPDLGASGDNEIQEVLKTLKSALAN